MFVRVGERINRLFSASSTGHSTLRCSRVVDAKHPEKISFSVKSQVSFLHKYQRANVQSLRTPWKRLESFRCGPPIEWKAPETPLKVQLRETIDSRQVKAARKIFDALVRTRTAKVNSFHTMMKMYDRLNMYDEQIKLMYRMEQLLIKPNQAIQDLFVKALFMTQNQANALKAIDAGLSDIEKHYNTVGTVLYQQKNLSGLLDHYNTVQDSHRKIKQNLLTLILKLVNALSRKREVRNQKRSPSYSKKELTDAFSFVVAEIKRLGITPTPQMLYAMIHKVDSISDASKIINLLTQGFGIPLNTFAIESLMQCAYEDGNSELAFSLYNLSIATANIPTTNILHYLFGAVIADEKLSEKERFVNACAVITEINWHIAYLLQTPTLRFIHQTRPVPSAQTCSIFSQMLRKNFPNITFEHAHLWTKTNMFAIPNPGKWRLNTTEWLAQLPEEEKTKIEEARSRMLAVRLPSQPAVTHTK